MTTTPVPTPLGEGAMRPTKLDEHRTSMQRHTAGAQTAADVLSALERQLGTRAERVAADQAALKAARDRVSALEDGLAAARKTNAKLLKHYDEAVLDGMVSRARAAGPGAHPRNETPSYTIANHPKNRTRQQNPTPTVESRRQSSTTTRPRATRPRQERPTLLHRSSAET